MVACNAQRRSQYQLGEIERQCCSIPCSEWNMAYKTETRARYNWVASTLALAHFAVRGQELWAIQSRTSNMHPRGS
jgi:hypothetical protein